jgi:hypothetical protein
MIKMAIIETFLSLISTTQNNNILDNTYQSNLKILKSNKNSSYLNENALNFLAKNNAEFIDETEFKKLKHEFKQNNTTISNKNNQINAKGGHITKLNINYQKIPKSWELITGNTKNNNTICITTDSNTIINKKTLKKEHIQSADKYLNLNKHETLKQTTELNKNNETIKTSNKGHITKFYYTNKKNNNKYEIEDQIITCTTPIKLNNTYDYAIIYPKQNTQKPINIYTILQ